MGAVQGAGDQAEQVGRWVRPGGVVELAQLRDRGARGDVAAGRAADAVADGEQQGPAYPESWLSLRTRPTSEIAA